MYVHVIDCVFKWFPSALNYFVKMDIAELYKIVNSSSQEQQELHFEVFRVFMQFPRVRCKKSWGLPFYYAKGPVAYTNNLKASGGIEVCFMAGKHLLSVSNTLQMKGRRLVAGIELLQYDEVKFAELSIVFEEALKIDFKRKSRTQ
jgi:hypothetical protein